MALTLAKVTLQSALTFTEKSLGSLPTITLTNGATHGHEVVTVTPPSSNGGVANVSIQIQSGTSTATEIRTAVLASPDALYWVTPTIESGQGSTALVTCVAATLSGGVAAAKATLAIDPLLIKAKSTGTSGNSVTFKFTGGATAGSEQVSVNTAAITVQIADGVSTAAQVIAAVAGDTGANALVDIVSSGPTLEQPMFVAQAPSFLQLSGGVAAAAASVIVQDLTFTWHATGTGGNGHTITYTHGATAGAEVVTVNASSNGNIKIQNGTSTATQVKTAADGVSAFANLFTTTISGTGSNAQKTVNQEVMSGGVAGPSPFNFYVDQAITALTSSFVFFSFNGMCDTVEIINNETTGSKGIIWSWDGTNVHGEMLPTKSITLLNAFRSGIWLKYDSGAPAYQVFAMGH